MSKKYKITQEIVDAFNKVKALEGNIDRASTVSSLDSAVIKADALVSALGKISILSEVGALADSDCIFRAKDLTLALYDTLADYVDEDVGELNDLLGSLEPYEEEEAPSPQPDTSLSISDHAYACLDGVTNGAVFVVRDGQVCAFGVGGNPTLEVNMARDILGVIFKGYDAGEVYTAGPTPDLIALHQALVTAVEAVKEYVDANEEELRTCIFSYKYGDAALKEYRLRLNVDWSLDTPVHEYVDLQDANVGWITWTKTSKSELFRELNKALSDIIPRLKQNQRDQKGTQIK